MEGEHTWDGIRAALLQWSAGLPRLLPHERDNLLATGAALPVLLAKSEDQSREELDAMILLSLAGERWPDLGASSKLILWERYCWALNLISAIEACGFQRPDEFDPATLLIEAWDKAGAVQIHDDFVRRYLPELLRDRGGLADTTGG